ncbi:hypothetical protein BJ322DRAFT_469667 [Thelephora terrestris]|uniref:Uncharacterized protein n=1 Tax=Thelephora terrestris TaxID=56493 RepID=A0A9P6L1U8_9AGAM|nr:hypothetical protein BJ322DRAFT_469667 [Thelephora terrestris]
MKQRLEGSRIIERVKVDENGVGELTRFEGREGIDITGETKLPDPATNVPSLPSTPNSRRSTLNSLHGPSPPWKTYKNLLDFHGFGDPLWEPSPLAGYERVKLGDVGYVRNGRFHFLFSAGDILGSRMLGVDVPPDFSPLEVGPATVRMPRSPGYLRTGSIKQNGSDVGSGRDIGWSMEPGSKLSFELTDERGAILITSHPTYRIDVERMHRAEEYTKRYYASWVEFARAKGHGDVAPILVTGVDLTKQWASLVYSDVKARTGCDFSVAPVDNLPGTWGSWRIVGSPVHTNCGPQWSHRRPPAPNVQNMGGSLTSASSPPEDYSECVFIRYITFRRRFLIPRLFKAGAGPHRLPKEDSEDDDAKAVAVGISGSDGLAEAISPETAPNAIHNAAPDARDGFDIVARFIFEVGISS